MGTARTLISNAMLRAGRIAVNETADNDEATAVLTVFNGLMHHQKARGVNLSWTDLTLNSTVPLEQELLFGIEAMLAKRLMEDDQEPVGPELASDAQAGMEALESYYRPIVPLQFEKGLTNMPSQRVIRRGSTT